MATLTFSKIEGIINDDLPFGALRSKDWWNNITTTSQGYAWTSAGWKVQSVDLKRRTVTFKKPFKEGMTRIHKKRRGKIKKAHKPFTPVPLRSRRIRKPSKTRIAKVIARAKNLEQRAAEGRYKMKLKPKSAYEKRLYKSDAKPTSQD